MATKPYTLLCQHGEPQMWQCPTLQLFPLTTMSEVVWHLFNGTALPSLYDVNMSFGPCKTLIPSRPILLSICPRVYLAQLG